MSGTTYLLERALLPDGVAADVRVGVRDGRFTEVLTEPDEHDTPDDVVRVPGLTIPGLANCHSHAFHRALRGRTQRERGTFWTWREQMYALAERLDPDTYHRLARAVFREMVAAGITSVGEFHYLHHARDGARYDDPNAMGRAVIAAAREAGIRITLLDTCYLTSAIGRPPEGVQRRFSDGDSAAWRERLSLLDDSELQEGVLIGQAFHSVRAVPREALVPFGTDPTRPLHVHLSEQRLENEQCLAAYGRTPTEVLADAGVLGERTTVVHATHLSESDIGLLGSARVFAGFCPTTERDLGDGIGPSRQLHAAGARLTLGSDSHAVIDLFEEMRAVELDERLAREQRGHWSAAELVEAATATGHHSLGWSDAGRIAVGQRADLVTLDHTSPRTAGTGGDEHTVVFAAVAEDVHQVMVDGRIVVRPGERAEVGRELDAAIEEVWA
ncbi:formimidoylglutamate deiminase [Nocardioides sp.]|uniref:formimidoylglutamate deiminase n=1 Tax=Nocardioides sp. TaxID=35761 RepID=UPI002B275D84|nr:formimidoylglutamate deiminase [Nocardioides sp.]